MNALPRRRSRLRCLALAAALLAPGCGWDGHLDILGYTTRPNYDPSIRTVYVPIFGNTTMRRGIEFELTRAVVREIESKTPMKVVSDRSCADTELTGKIVNETKRIAMFNQLGEVRDAEMTMTVELVWRDLRPGHCNEILSRPLPGRPADPAPVGPPPQDGPPVTVQSLATFTPELGQSRTTAEKTMIDRMAVQIISMMEKPW
jgi:hypothetical protein